MVSGTKSYKVSGTKPYTVSGTKSCKVSGTKPYEVSGTRSYYRLLQGIWDEVSVSLHSNPSTPSFAGSPATPLPIFSTLSNTSIPPTPSLTSFPCPGRSVSFLTMFNLQLQLLIHFSFLPATVSSLSTIMLWPLPLPLSSHSHQPRSHSHQPQTPNPVPPSHHLTGFPTPRPAAAARLPPAPAAAERAVVAESWARWAGTGPCGGWRPCGGANRRTCGFGCYLSSLPSSIPPRTYGLFLLYSVMQLLPEQLP